MSYYCPWISIVYFYRYSIHASLGYTGTHFPIMVLISLVSHHLVVLTKSPSLVTTLLTLDLWLDESIIIFSVCLRLRYIAIYRLNLCSCSLSVFAHNRVNVKNVLCYFIFKLLPKFKIYPFTIFAVENTRLHNKF